MDTHQDTSPPQVQDDGVAAVTNSTAQNATTPITSRHAAIPELYRLAALLGVRVELPYRAPTNPNACLLGMPGEIRNRIWELLNVNPILGKLASISQEDGFGARQAYDLCPAILRVSRQVRDENFVFLYEKNTFCVVCCPVTGFSWEMREGTVNSPLTRYYGEASPYPALREVSSFAKVRKWNVIISARNLNSLPARGFFELCRAISRGAPKRIEVAIVPKFIEYGVTEWEVMDVALSPLRLLRNVESFMIRDTSPFEIPDTINQDEDAIQFISAMDDYPVLEVDLTLLAQSNDPVEKCFEMFGNLVRYAQAFEKIPRYKQDMDRTKFGEQCDSDPDILTVPEVETEESGWYNSTNPFRMARQPHPVEAGLHDACFCSDDENVSDFKTHRAAVVEYLEPQFQRIQAAASHMLEFIKEEKISGGLFDCYDDLDYDFSEGGTSKVVTAMVLLEQYDAAFDRDMPLHIKAHIRQHRSGFKKLYAPYGIGVDLLDDLNSTMESRSIAKFVKYFKMAVDRLDNLFLEMLRARQELFKWDIGNSADRQCDIDPQLHRNTEHIMWDVNEPNLTPVSFEDYTPTEAGDSDRDSDSDDGDHHNDSESTESAEHETDPDDTDEANDDQYHEDEDAIEDSVSEASSEQHDSVDGDGDSDEVNMDDGVSDNGEDEQDQVHNESAPLPNYGRDVSETHAAGKESDDLQVNDNDVESLSSHQGDSEDADLESVGNMVHPFAGTWSFVPLSTSQSEANTGTVDELGVAADATRIGFDDVA